jgi:hypothetical protein
MLAFFRSGDYCTLTGSITSDGDGVIIEEDNIILDGALSLST